MSLLFKNSIVSILKGNGTKVGTGFFVSENLIVTCTHVADLAGEIPQIQINGSNKRLTARLLPEYCRESNNGDVAFLQVKSMLAGVKPLKLGKAEHSPSGSPFQTFGYPYVGDGIDGINARGEILGQTKENDQQLIQLRSPELDLGHSGSPVFDENRGVVIGMIVSVYKSNMDSKLRDTAFAIPTEFLWEVCSEIRPSDISPYLGLTTFTEETERFFFGRDALTKKLLDDLRGGNRLIALFGPSGSGKSSLVKAGLLPALKKGQLSDSNKWAQFSMRPADDPFNQLRSAGIESFDIDQLLSSHDEAENAVLFIDQFEELFTSCPDNLAKNFINDLATALNNPKLILILAMRDDFYSTFNAKAAKLAASEHLKVENVPETLNQDELLAIIEQPAREVNLILADGLASVIIKDLQQDGIVRSSTLPLLEFALTQLWERRRDGVLTHDAYQTIEGVTGSLARWADNAYSDLPRDDQAFVEGFFTSLIHLGDESQGLPDTRRRRLLSDLVTSAPVHRLIKHFTDRRLTITRGDDIELVHDALLFEWGRLRNWIKNNRNDLRIQESVADAARQWEISSRQDDALLVHRGNRLDEALALFDKINIKLTPTDKTYLLACKSLRDRDQQKQRRIITASITTALIFFILSSLAWWNSQISRSQTLAAQAQVELDGPFPERGPLLALKALENYPYTTQAEQSLARTIWDSRVRAIIPNYFLFTTGFSPDGKYFLASSSDEKTLLLRETASLKIVQQYKGHTSSLSDAKFSDDGKKIYSVAQDGTIRVWDTLTGIQLSMVNTNQDYSITISSDGLYLASIGISGTEISLWKINSAGELNEYYVIPNLPFRVNRIVFSPDGLSIAGVSGDGFARIWRLEEKDSLPKLFEQGGNLTSIAFSPDGKKLITGGSDESTCEWDVESGKLLNRQIWRSEISALQFNKNGTKLLIGDWSGDVHVIDITSGTEALTLKSHNFYGNFGTTTMPVGFAEFNPMDDKQVISTGLDGSIRLWDATLSQNPNVIDLTDIYGISFNLDHSQALFMAGDNTARVINLNSGEDIRVFPFLETSNGIYNPPVIMTHNGKKAILIHTFKGYIEVLDVKTGELLMTISEPLSVTSPVTINKTDTLIAVANEFENTIVFYDLHSGQQINRITNPQGVSLVNGLMFSPDDHWLLITGGQSMIVDLSSQNSPLLLTNDVTDKASFSSDGKYLVTMHSYSHLIRVWDVKTWNKLAEWSAGTNVDNVDISPNGDRVVTGNHDGTIIVWNSLSGAELYTLKAHNDWIQYIAFDQSGTLIWSVGANEDGTIKSWRIWPTTETLLAYAQRCCEVRTLYPDERVEFGLSWELRLKDFSGRQPSTVAGVFFFVVGLLSLFLFGLNIISFNRTKKHINLTNQKRNWLILFGTGLLAILILLILSGAMVIFLLWTDPSRDEAWIILTILFSLPLMLCGNLYGIWTHTRRRYFSFIRTVGGATIVGLLGGVFGGAIGGAVAFLLFQNVPLEQQGLFLQTLFQDNSFESVQYTPLVLLLTTSSGFAVLMGIFVGITGLVGGVFSVVYRNLYFSRKVT